MRSMSVVQMVPIISCGTRARTALTDHPEPLDLCDALIDAAMDEGWTPGASAVIADVAIRRWNSFPRRHPKRSAFEDRVLDLTRGLRERSPVDALYVGPGD